MLFKSNKPKRRFLFQCFLAAVVIVIGLLFTLSNLYSFSIGYFAYRTPNEQTLDIPQDTDDDIPLTKTAYSSQESTHFKKVFSSAINPNKANLYPIRPTKGEKIGELYIPKLDATLPIYEGTDEEDLLKGVGHYSESVLPGESDNCVLSGHRDTVFRKLGNIGDGDRLIIRTLAGEFEYVVNKVRIVDKEDRTVIVPKPKATLTVTTCYPFHYIGAAPKRYILVAYLASETMNP